MPDNDRWAGRTPGPAEPGRPGAPRRPYPGTGKRTSYGYRNDTGKRPAVVPPALLEATLSLDEAAGVPDELDVSGVAAKDWFDGEGRFGFD